MLKINFKLVFSNPHSTSYHSVMSLQLVCIPNRVFKIINKKERVFLRERNIKRQIVISYLLRQYDNLEIKM